MRSFVDFDTMYDGNYEKVLMKGDKFRQFYPIFFIISLIHCAKINKIYHIQRNVTLMELRSTCPISDVYDLLSNECRRYIRP